MKKLHLINILKGIVIATGGTQINLYVKEHFNGEGYVNTMASNLSVIPWAVKFIYGLLADTYCSPKTSKLKVMVVLPFFIFLLNFIPIFVEFSLYQFYFICFCIALPNAIFQCMLNAFIYQEINAKVYDKEMITNTIFGNFTGRFLASILSLLINYIFYDNLRMAIKIGYGITAAIGIILIYPCYKLFTESKTPKDEISQPLITSEKEKQTVYQKIKLLISNRNFLYVMLYIILTNLIPTFTGYFPMFLIANTSIGGLGSHQSAIIVNTIVFYIAGAFGAKLYTLYTRRRAATLKRTHSGNQTKELRRELSILMNVGNSLSIILMEILFYLPVEMSTTLKATVFNVFSGFGAVLSAMNWAFLSGINGEECDEGIEASTFSVYTAVVNFGGIAADQMGVIVIGLVANNLGYNVKEFFFMKTAVYVSFVVSVCAWPLFYLIE